MNTKFINTVALSLVVLSIGLLGFKNVKREKARPILNVSYDPTRELYTEINAKFVAKYEEDTGSWRTGRKRMW
jgi:sulfate/thiosulfate transport system substrate-binding protein